MGGLTVLAELAAALPQEDFIYLGDTARLPYGTKSPATVQSYALQASKALVAKQVKALVVACNTASGLALPSLQDAYPELPIFGVVEPGAHAAYAKADSSGVLVLATESTVDGGAYQRCLAQLDPQLPVQARACPLWVTLAEMGDRDSELAQHILRADLPNDEEAEQPRTLLLGCTHFPVFKQTIQALRPNLNVVDSASTTAAWVAEQLAEAGLLKPQADKTSMRFLATDGAERFARIAEIFLGQPASQVELVDL